MCKTALMHEAQTIEHLPEEVSSLWFGKAPTQRHEIKQLTATHELECNEFDLFAALLRIDLLAGVHFNKSDDVLMLQLSERLDLCIDELIEGLIRVDNLYRVPSTCFVFR